MKTLAILQASNVTRSQDAQSRAARRRTRNQRRSEALARDTDAETSSSDSDFSLKQAESDQEREDFISNAAAAIARYDSSTKPFFLAEALSKCMPEDQDLFDKAVFKSILIHSGMVSKIDPVSYTYLTHPRTVMP